MWEFNKSRYLAVAQWSRGDLRAPHKPILILYALARIQAGQPRLVPFAQAERDLTEVLGIALPTRKTQVAYPFWNLQSDGIWEVHGAEGARLRGGNKEPVLADFRRPEVVGGLLEQDATWLAHHPSELRSIAKAILAEQFPVTLQDEIAQLLGLDLSNPGEPPAHRAEMLAEKRRRDPAFREQVLRAYEFRCAICGYDGRLDTTVIGLEAAHVQWHQFAGPDTLDNGMALCSLHHKLFDVGAFSLQPDLAIVVSDLMIGGGMATDLILRYHGQPLRGPRADKPPVAQVYREWHWGQVFKGPGRA